MAGERHGYRLLPRLKQTAIWLRLRSQ